MNMLSLLMGFGIFFVWDCLEEFLVIRLVELIAGARSGCTSVLCIMRRYQDYTDMLDIRRLKVWIPGLGGTIYTYVYLYVYAYIYIYIYIYIYMCVCL